MESDRDDAERLRRRREAADRAATRRPGAAVPSRVRVGKVVAGAVAGLKSFEVQAYLVTGAETEGTTGTLTDASYSFFATNLGAGTPAVNEVVVCHYVDYRWCFRK